MGEWIKEMWYVYIHNGILLNLKKEGNPAICDNMDEPRRHYAKWNKPVTENKYFMVSAIYGIWNGQTNGIRE